MKTDLGLRLAGLWLLLYGWQAFTTPGFTSLSVSMGCIAFVAGFILLFGKHAKERSAARTPEAGSTPSS
jgi:hypothetical protein